MDDPKNDSYSINIQNAIHQALQKPLGVSLIKIETISRAKSAHWVPHGIEIASAKNIHKDRLGIMKMPLGAFPVSRLNKKRKEKNIDKTSTKEKKRKDPNIDKTQPIDNFVWRVKIKGNDLNVTPERHPRVFLRYYVGTAVKRLIAF